MLILCVFRMFSTFLAIFLPVVLSCCVQNLKNFLELFITFAPIFCRNFRHTRRTSLFACSSVTSSAIIQKLIFSFKTSRIFSLTNSAIPPIISFWILGDIYCELRGPLKKWLWRISSCFSKAFTIAIKFLRFEDRCLFSSRFWSSFPRWPRRVIP